VADQGWINKCGPFKVDKNKGRKLTNTIWPKIGTKVNTAARIKMPEYAFGKLNCSGGQKKEKQ